MKVKEFNIPVPWGHVAAKCWGDENNPPVLTLHDIEDNAGSFDNLIPKLPQSYYYMCIDLPGHGKSSQFPKRAFIHLFNYVLVIRRIVKHFNWESYYLMGHGIGGQTAILSAIIFCKGLKGLILLDGLDFTVSTPNIYVDTVRERIENFYISENKEFIHKPIYSYDEALVKMMADRGGWPASSAEIILKRGLKEVSEGRFQFSFDERIRNAFHPINDLRYLNEVYKLEPLDCPILVIVTQCKNVKQNDNKFLNFIKSYKNVKIVQVRGDHSVHLHKPDKVISAITKFLTPVGKL